MKTKFKYAAHTPEILTHSGKYLVYPESTSLAKLLLRWTNGEPMGAEMTTGNYQTTFAARPSSDLTDIDRMRRISQSIQSEHDDTLKQLQSLSTAVPTQQQQPTTPTSERS